jgi:hypothetical protein
MSLFILNFYKFFNDYKFLLIKSFINILYLTKFKILLNNIIINI